MVTDIIKYIRENKPDQCETGLIEMLRLFQELNPKIYCEIGCANLFTSFLFHERLAKDGLMIGIDLKKYPRWHKYNQVSKGLCKFLLLDNGSDNKKVIEKTKEALTGRKIDCLFIDGCHEYKEVKSDWDNYSPLVRSGGLVFFHDWDPPPVARGELRGQGAAMVCNQLEKAGFRIENITNTSIGTAYIRMP
jgi:predicted O-methyltransferase YrrM